MRINEIFGPSIQGEGQKAGQISTFVRLAGCNLNCAFCDTRYARRGKNMKLDSVVREVELVNAPNVVITGGEPYLQNELPSLVSRLKDRYHVTIETNGTLYKPTPAQLVSISPKLNNSLPLNERLERLHDKARKDYTPLNLLMTNNNYQVKFVVGTYDDVREARKLMHLLAIPRERVWFMPQARNRKELAENDKIIAAYAIEQGVNYSDRLHLRIWDKKRGV